MRVQRGVVSYAHDACPWMVDYLSSSRTPTRAFKCRSVDLLIGNLTFEMAQKLKVAQSVAQGVAQVVLGPGPFSSSAAGCAKARLCPRRSTATA